MPPLLLGLPGDNTFSNYAEANRAFRRQTVLPLVARVQKSFRWITLSKDGRLALCRSRRFAIAKRS
ncbi:Phage head portal protein, HK97 family [Methylocystis sp. SC2]|nr:Phage head portal protein, HK97 family [Methylocystis sp. SC2]